MTDERSRNRAVRDDVKFAEFKIGAPQDLARCKARPSQHDGRSGMQWNDRMMNLGCAMKKKRWAVTGRSGSIVRSGDTLYPPSSLCERRNGNKILSCESTDELNSDRFR